MLIPGLFALIIVLVSIVWYGQDMCPNCSRHAMERVDVGPRCQHCGWFEH